MREGLGLKSDVERYLGAGGTRSATLSSVVSSSGDGVNHVPSLAFTSGGGRSYPTPFHTAASPVDRYAQDAALTPSPSI
jgi:hypothetical protein